MSKRDELAFKYAEAYPAYDRYDEDDLVACFQAGWDKGREELEAEIAKLHYDITLLHKGYQAKIDELDFESAKDAERAEAENQKLRAALTDWLYLFDHRAMMGGRLEEVVSRARRVLEDKSSA